MRPIIQTVFLTWLLNVTMTVANDTDRPNIILFMVDDFGYECVTANGGESYQTPNIDRLASTGIRFEHCHVQPLCTPTRVQLMTGKYNVRNYLKFGVLMRDQVTFGSLLKDAGYRTGICGKWQLGREVDSPQHFGFEESCLWQHTRRPPRYANPGLEYNGVERDFDAGQYGPTLVNDFALDFITRHCKEAFFLYYPMVLTHDPFEPTPASPLWHAKTKSEVVENVRHFAEMTAWMDQMVGRVIEKLERLSIRDNTLVIFIGDNGTHSTITSRFKGEDFKGGKGKTTHRGTHVPCIINWPKEIENPSVNQDLVSSVDFLPTLCEAVGFDLPSGIDGASFYPQLIGAPSSPRDYLYSWYSPRQRMDLSVKECAFNHSYKLYRSGEFYDLVADPDEGSPLPVANLSQMEVDNYRSLKEVLGQFENARPKNLDERLRAEGVTGGPAGKKNNRPAVRRERSVE